VPSNSFAFNDNIIIFHQAENVRAVDTFGAGESLPAFLHVVGEVPMGQAANVAIAVGEAVYTGGELPAMIILDAVARRIPGVLGKIESLEELRISSPEVYGTCEGFITESAPLNPTTPYAASKASGDLSLFTFYKNFNFPLVMIRATNVYGAYQQLFKIIPSSIIYIKNKKKIELHGGGEAVKSYINIRDVSNGELLAMEQGISGEIYHISPDNGVAVKDVVRTIAEKMGVPFEEAAITVAERLGQDKAYTIDSSKIRKELAWQPNISLEDGINQTVQWVMQYFDEIQQQPLEYLHQP